jgi:hypothetical protein
LSGKNAGVPPLRAARSGRDDTFKERRISMIRGMTSPRTAFEPWTAFEP